MRIVVAAVHTADPEEAILRLEQHERQAFGGCMEDADARAAPVEASALADLGHEVITQAIVLGHHDLHATPRSPQSTTRPDPVEERSRGTGELFRARAKQVSRACSQWSVSGNEMDQERARRSGAERGAYTIQLKALAANDEDASGGPGHTST